MVHKAPHKKLKKIKQREPYKNTGDELMSSGTLGSPCSTSGTHWKLWIVFNIRWAVYHYDNKLANKETNVKVKKTIKNLVIQVCSHETFLT